MDESLAPSAPDFAALWAGFCRGEREAQDQLLAACYQDLRAIARGLLVRDSTAQHIQSTELAHEAALRQVLVDEVRRQRAQKRQVRGLLTTWFEPGPDAAAIDIEALDQALSRLAVFSPERARVVELRFFAGLGLPEIAGVRHWHAARAWLMCDMVGGKEHASGD